MIKVPHMLLVILCTAACRDTIHLEDTSGSTTLTYSCDQFESLARSTDDQAVVREYAVRIARQAADRRDVALLTRLSSAYEKSEPAELEKLVVGYICEHGTALEEPPPVFPEPGTTARNFELRQLTLEPPYDDGPLVSLQSHRGSVVVLDVFGTWCPPCVKKYPAMAALAGEYTGKGVQFLGILLNDSPQRAAHWFSEQGGMVYPFLLETGSDVETIWGLHGAPRMFVIDQEGLIVQRCLGCQYGPLTPDSLPILLDSLLAGESEGGLTSASS